MNSAFKISLVFTVITVCFFSCQKEINKPIDAEEMEITAGKSQGAIQVSGTGFWDGTDVCNSAAQGANFALTMNGDLNGCLYVFVEEFECSPGGTYREVGKEKFVGTYNGQYGEFWTTYRFEAKYEGCAEDGSFLGAEILGRCQHPIVEGSGTGVFTGVTGRLDLKDDIEAANYPYRGHFRF